MDYLIKSINWALTYRCNLKCTHCDIWKNPNKKELSIDEIKNIVSSKIIQKSYKYYGDFFDIALTGGELLLVENLYEIILTIDEALPGSIHTLSTNGILKNKLIELLVLWNKKGKAFRKINISIDGNSQIHDKQRGISGSFNKTMETIISIRKLFPKQVIEIKLTITKTNYKYISYIAKLADKLGVFFSFKPVENMLNYTNQGDLINSSFNEDEIKNIEKQIINNVYIDKQNYYINKKFFLNIPNYLRNGLGKSKKICNIANDSLSIMPDGKIYACILMNLIGNIKDNSLDDIWMGEKIKQQRIDIKEGKCPECMLMCGSFKTKKIYNVEI